MTGIHTQIEKYPNMKIVAEVDDQSDAAVAATKIGAALLANPNTAVIIGCQAPSAVGAVTAVKEAVHFVKEKLGVEMELPEKIACDFSNENRQCLKKHCPYYTITQSENQ